MKSCYASFNQLYHYLSLRNTFNLNNSPITRRHSLKTRPRRHRLRQEINVDFIHGRKVLHIRKVDIVFDHFVERGAG